LRDLKGEIMPYGLEFRLQAAGRETSDERENSREQNSSHPDRLKEELQTLQALCRDTATTEEVFSPSRNRP